MLINNTIFDTINAGANFSACRKYRYKLWRIWDSTMPLVMFIGLNPSTANETEPDNTIKSVTRISKNLGFGGFYMMNCFPMVSRHPERLQEFIHTTEHAGQEIKNYNELRQTGTLCQQVIFAWGSFKEVTPAIVEKLVMMFPGAMALKINANGSPQHPLYISSKVQPVKYQLYNAAKPIIKRISLPIENMVLGLVRCVKCGAAYGKCDCWTKCKCNWLFEKGSKCSNPNCY